MFVVLLINNFLFTFIIIIIFVFIAIISTVLYLFNIDKNSDITGNSISGTIPLEIQNASTLMSLFVFGVKKIFNIDYDTL